MADERIRLVLDVTGVQDLALLKETLKDVSSALGSMDTKLEQVTDTATDAANAINAAAGGESSPASGVRRGGGSGKGVSDGGKKGGAAGLAQLLMQLGYVADDAQYGIRGLSNNVTGLAMSMGLGMGAAGAAQILIVALNQLLDKFPDLVAQLTEGVKGFGAVAKTAGEMTENVKKNREMVEELAKEVEELGNKSKKTATEYGQLAAKTIDLANARAEAKRIEAAQKADESMTDQLSVDDEAYLSEMGAAGKAALRNPVYQQAKEAEYLRRQKQSAEIIQRDNLGSSIARLRQLAKDQGIPNAENLSEQEILDVLRDRYSVVDPETNRVISQGTNADVMNAAATVGRNRAAEQARRLAAAAEANRASVDADFGAVTGGATSREAYADAWSRLPPEARKTIDAKLFETRLAQYTAEVGQAPSDNSRLAGDTATFRRNVANDKSQVAMSQVGPTRGEAEKLERDYVARNTAATERSMGEYAEQNRRLAERQKQTDEREAKQRAANAIRARQIWQQEQLDIGSAVRGANLGARSPEQREAVLGRVRDVAADRLRQAGMDGKEADEAATDAIKSYQATLARMAALNNRQINLQSAMLRQQIAAEVRMNGLERTVGALLQPTQAMTPAWQGGNRPR